jgi:hypothetical protein
LWRTHAMKADILAPDADRRVQEAAQPHAHN